MEAEGPPYEQCWAKISGPKFHKESYGSFSLLLSSKDLEFIPLSYSIYSVRVKALEVHVWVGKNLELASESPGAKHRILWI